MNAVKVEPHMVLRELVRHRKHHAATDKKGMPSRARTCFLGAIPRYEEHLPRPLEPVLIRPYLRSRMERAADDPCLFSVFVNGSVDLIIEQYSNPSQQYRQDLTKHLLNSFDIAILDPRRTVTSRGLFDTFFHSYGLSYWLPIYNAAHLTIYPKPEDNIRLFYVLRLSYNAAQLRSDRADVNDLRWIAELLAQPPTTPEYARLFAIDCFNLIANSKSELMLSDFLSSNTGRLLSAFSLSERIWCAMKQNRKELSNVLLNTVVIDRVYPSSDDVTKRRIAIPLIIEALIEVGETAHPGRTVVEELIKCKRIDDVKRLCQDFDPEDVAHVQARMRSRRV